MVPPASHRVSRVRRYSGTGRQSLRVRVRGSNPVSPAFPGRSAPAGICHCATTGPTTPAGPKRPPVWPLPRSLATTGGISFDFSSSGYLDVSVPRVASPGPMDSGPGRAGTTPPGFPHSETCGSRAVCASPQLIAACHVLRRLPVPRHPPCALTIFSSMASYVHIRCARGLRPRRDQMRSS